MFFHKRHSFFLKMYYNRLKTLLILIKKPPKLQYFYNSHLIDFQVFLPANSNVFYVGNIYYKYFLYNK